MFNLTNALNQLSLVIFYFATCFVLSCSPQKGPVTDENVLVNSVDSTRINHHEFNPLNQLGMLDSVRTLGAMRLDSLAKVRAAQPQQGPRNKSDWHVYSSRDQMTGSKNFYCRSETVRATQQMSFPYDDVSAHLVVGCEDNYKWVYASFSESPNLQMTATKNGYDTFRTRVKFNQQVEWTNMLQEWGSKQLYFSDEHYIISRLKQADTLLLELDWYGEGRTYFRFSCNGSSVAIDDVLNSCD